MIARLNRYGLNIAYRKVGGITFIRIGQFGFTFFVSRKPFDA